MGTVYQVCVRTGHAVNGQGLAGRPLLCVASHSATIVAAAGSTREQQQRH